MFLKTHKADDDRREEDLGLYGNQLNYMQACWTIGYVIGEIPSNIVLTRFRPSLWLPALEVSELTLYIETQLTIP